MHRLWHSVSPTGDGVAVVKMRLPPPRGSDCTVDFFEQKGRRQLCCWAWQISCVSHIPTEDIGLCDSLICAVASRFRSTVGGEQKQRQIEKLTERRQNQFRITQEHVSARTIAVYHN